MNRAYFSKGIIAILILGGCDSRTNKPDQITITNQTEPETETVAMDAADMPAPIVRDASYRCDDGKALYVSVLEGKQAVLVRDSRSDVAVRLEREGDSDPLSGSGRILSGTGDEVRYSSADRPLQSCREAEE